MSKAKPSPIKKLITNEHVQNTRNILTLKVQAREGSPARHVDSSCEAGNKKSTRWMDKVMKTDRQPGL